MNSGFLDFCKDLLLGSHPVLLVIALVIGICYFRSIRLNLSIGDRASRKKKNRIGV